MSEKNIILKGKVALLYNNNNNNNDARAFNVNYAGGSFIVMDYSYDPLDREIYWERDTRLVRPGTTEYTDVSDLVKGYVNGIYAKFKKKPKNWPIL